MIVVVTDQSHNLSGVLQRIHYKMCYLSKRLRLPDLLTFKLSSTSNLITQRALLFLVHSRIKADNHSFRYVTLLLSYGVISMFHSVAYLLPFYFTTSCRLRHQLLFQTEFVSSTILSFITVCISHRLDPLLTLSRFGFARRFIVSFIFLFYYFVFDK